MRWKAFGLLVLTAGLGVNAIAATGPASAQTRAVRDSAALPTDMSAQQRVYRVPRVRIYPIYRPNLLYRQCADWYVVEARATGPTVVPRIRCWWVRG